MFNYLKAISVCKKYHETVYRLLSDQEMGKNEPISHVKIIDSKQELEKVESSKPRRRFDGSLDMKLTRLSNEYSRELDLADKSTKTSEYLTFHKERHRGTDIYEACKQSPYDNEINASLVMWYDFARLSAAFLDQTPNWCDIALSCINSGYVPIYWQGEFPKGYMVVYAVPGRAVPLPSHCIATPQQIAEAESPPRIMIDRSKWPVYEQPVINSTTWNDLLKVPANDAVRTLLSPILEGSGEAGTICLYHLTERALRIEVLKEKASRRLAVTFRCTYGPTKETVIYFEEPYTGRLNGLPKEVVQVVRRHNGICRAISGGMAEWFRYLGPTKGFDFEWGADLWDITDKFDDDLWKKKPLVPYTDGSDLYAYHPANPVGDSLEMVRIDHESASIEPLDIQHPGLGFLRILAIELGAYRNE